MKLPLIIVSLFALIIYVESQPLNNSSQQGIPASFDWRASGAVTPAKDQGTCGASYAFAAVAVLETLHKLYKNQLVSLSPQEIIDCSSAYGNQGCDGGTVRNAFKYVIKNSGISGSTSYPYEAQPNVCRSNENKFAPIVSFVGLAPGENNLVGAVYNYGPVAVAVDAHLDSFQKYTSGIYFDPECDNTGTTDLHWMVLIGYGTSSDGQDYWLLKNSWGTSWGMNGLMKLARNRDNHCCISCKGTYAQIN